MILSTLSALNALKWYLHKSIYNTNLCILYFRVPLTRGFNKMGSTIRTKTAIAQRKLQNAAQKREANMAVVLVSTVIMFVICHTPRMLFVM